MKCNQVEVISKEYNNNFLIINDKIQLVSRSNNDTAIKSYYGC